MFSIILSTASKYLFPLFLIFSFFIFLRGHNEPGGGFIGGLIAAAAYSLYLIANGIENTKKLLGIDPVKLISTGLLIALLSSFISLLFSTVFFTGHWLDYNFPVVGKVGTPLLFDLGVYLVVMGIVLKIIFSLCEAN